MHFVKSLMKCHNRKGHTKSFCCKLNPYRSSKWQDIFSPKIPRLLNETAISEKMSSSELNKEHPYFTINLDEFKAASSQEATLLLNRNRHF